VKLVPAQAGIHGQFSTLTIRYTQYSILNTQYVIRNTKYAQKGWQKARIFVKFCLFLQIFTQKARIFANFTSFFSQYIMPIMPKPHILTRQPPFLAQKPTSLRKTLDLHSILDNYSSEFC